MVQGLPATVLAGENQTAPQRRVIHPLPIPKPLAAAWPSHLDVVPSPATPLALVLETQVTAQTTFERAREFELKVNGRKPRVITVMLSRATQPWWRHEIILGRSTSANNS